MKTFKCKECSSTELYITRDEVLSQKVEVVKGENDFLFGKEDVLQGNTLHISCAQNHILTDNDGNKITEFEDVCDWISEHGKDDGNVTPNPFALWYIGIQGYSYDEIQRAEKVSIKLVEILDGLAEHLKEYGNIGAYMEIAVIKVKMLRLAHVGVGDTETDQCIRFYLKEKLREKFDELVAEDMARTFHERIH
jgi:hypothetical protein